MFITVITFRVLPKRSKPFRKIEELALLNAINSPEGFSLKHIFDEGGCCYVVGSMRNSKIITAQRMLLVRLYQLAEKRDRVIDVPAPLLFIFPN